MWMLGPSWSSFWAGSWPPTGAPRLKGDPPSSGCSRLTNIQIWPHQQTPPQQCNAMHIFHTNANDNTIIITDTNTNTDSRGCIHTNLSTAADTRSPLSHEHLLMGCKPDRFPPHLKASGLVKLTSAGTGRVHLRPKWRSTPNGEVSSRGVDLFL